MDNYIGRLLDNRYEILESIGSGGMAVVYRARDVRLNRFVAIKILKDELSQDAEFRRRFHAESQAVAMLSHPNIVSVYDVSHSDNVDYIVMELIEGITLKQYMEQKGQLNWREALHFATQIGKALEHAHSRGIIHRDIKPHNIMILKDGSVKVADFGIARVSSAQNTLTREALGSVHYISPEQAKGGHVDFRSDLYSLGVVLYEMLTGRPPFDGDTPVSVAIQHINAKPVMPRELNPSIPAGLEQITMHAMAAEIAKRYACATDMLLDLEEFRKNPNTLFDFSAAAEISDVDRLLRETSGHTEKPAPRAQPRTAAERAAHAPVPKTRPAEPEKTGKKSVNKLPMIAGIICIALALFGIIYFLWTFILKDVFSTTAEDTVPQFIGAYYDNINEQDYPNFNIELTAWETSNQYEYGYVMRQTPEAGKTVKVGTTIELTVSKGKENNKMPGLVNMALQNAQNVLSSMSIQVTPQVEYQTSDVYTEGYIISTEPAEGATLTDGQTVILYVSQGVEIELVEVPELVGQDVEDALALIEEVGLAKGVLTSDTSDLPKGTVTFQSLKQGEMVKPNTVVNLRVSNGPDEAAEPQITSLSHDTTAMVGDRVLLSISATSADNGVLTYAWYVSTSGTTDDATLILRSAEDNTTCTVDTSKAGIYYYFCRVVNTLGDSTKTANSDMIQILVEEATATEKTKVLTVTMPDDGAMHEVAIKVGGIQQGETYQVDMSQVQGGQINIEVTGAGTQIVDIYVDGQLRDSQTIDFDTVG